MPVLLPSAAERKPRALETMKILKEVGYLVHTDSEPDIGHTKLGDRVKRGDPGEDD